MSTSHRAAFNAKRFVKHKHSYTTLDQSPSGTPADPSVHVDVRKPMDVNGQAAPDLNNVGTSSSTNKKGVSIKQTDISQGPLVRELPVQVRSIRRTLKVSIISLVCAAVIFCLLCGPDRYLAIISAQVVLLRDAVGLRSMNPKVNYASLVRGASIIGPLTSETLSLSPRPDVVFTKRVLGRPMSYAAPPSTILRSVVEPRVCWAFQGHQGHIGVRLSREISVKDLEMVYLPAPADGSVDSAPRTFRIWGIGHFPPQLFSFGRNSAFLARDIDTPPYIAAVLDHGLIALPLVNSVYNVTSSQSHQTFNVEEDMSKFKTNAVVIEVLDNWGDEELTCLYGIRVFGDP